MSMGWKPGEGVGAKMARKHRKKLKWSLTQQTPQSALPKSPSPPPSSSDDQSQSMEGVKVYGVTMPPPQFHQTLTKTSRLDDDDDDDDDFDDHVVSLSKRIRELIFVFLCSMQM